MRFYVHSSGSITNLIQPLRSDKTNWDIKMEPKQPMKQQWRQNQPENISHRVNGNGTLYLYLPLPLLDLMVNVNIPHINPIP